MKHLLELCRAEYLWLRNHTCVPGLVGWWLAAYAVYGWANAVAWVVAYWGGF